MKFDKGSLSIVLMKAAAQVTGAVGEVVNQVETLRQNHSDLEGKAKQAAQVIATTATQVADVVVRAVDQEIAAITKDLNVILGGSQQAPQQAPAPVVVAAEAVSKAPVAKKAAKKISAKSKKKAKQASR